MSNVFFTADQHFGHNNILKFCKRPFADMTEMREALIERHNAKVRKGDLVYHLGDMFWQTMTEEEALSILNRLVGQHYFVWGNHDELIEGSPALQQKFVWLKDLTVIKPRAQYPKIVLCHYAMRVWRGSHNGTWQLYGHSHAALPEIANRSFDVGVDAWDFAPAALEEVAAKMRQKIEAGANDPMAPAIAADPWQKGQIPPPLPEDVRTAWLATDSVKRCIE